MGKAILKIPRPCLRSAHFGFLLGSIGRYCTFCLQILKVNPELKPNFKSNAAFALWLISTLVSRDFVLWPCDLVTSVWKIKKLIKNSWENVMCFFSKVTMVPWTSVGGGGDSTLVKTPAKRNSPHPPGDRGSQRGVVTFFTTPPGEHLISQPGVVTFFTVVTSFTGGGDFLSHPPGCVCLFGCLFGAYLQRFACSAGVVNFLYSGDFLYRPLAWKKIALISQKYHEVTILSNVHLTKVWASWCEWT